MPVMSRPSNTILPDVGGTSQVSILKKVVLPAPFGPMMPRSSPALHDEIDAGVGDQAAVVLGEAGRLQDRARVIASRDAAASAGK